MMTSTNAPIPSPLDTWREMLEGNARFVAGTPSHPRQDVERREEVAESQAPMAALFGCSDSRLAAEIIFDKGIGDLFVVRNAGQVISDSVVGSLEYAVGVLKVPLIVVLGHDQCGAVLAAIDSVGPDAPMLPPHISALISKIVPAVKRVSASTDGSTEPHTVDSLVVGREHLRDTIAELIDVSELISDAVAAGTLAIVGANYRLLEGRAEPDIMVGLAQPSEASTKPDSTSSSPDPQPPRQKETHRREPDRRLPHRTRHHGRGAGAAVGALRRADPACGRELPDLGHRTRDRADRGPRPHQAGGGHRQPRARHSRPGQSPTPSSLRQTASSRVSTTISSRWTPTRPAAGPRRT